MEIITDPAALQARCLGWKKEGLSIALVPTMGFFHEGHESLMREGRRLADRLVVSLFVNPTQFSPTEDLAKYPRSPESDTATAQKHGTDILFMPEAAHMYSPKHATWVEVPSLASTLCARTRPTHFRGVATVVTKLFMLSLPDWALFGQKDWQQLAIIKRMTEDLAIPVVIIGMPVVREADGLALSSRNAHLTSKERALAPHIYKGLQLAQELVLSGATRDVSELTQAVRQYWQKTLPDVQEDYLCFVDPDSLQPVAEVTGSTLVATALHMKGARLIDNLLIEP